MSKSMYIWVSLYIICKVKVIPETVVRITERNKQLFLTRQMYVQGPNQKGGVQSKTEGIKLPLFPKKGVEVVKVQEPPLMFKAW